MSITSSRESEVVETMFRANKRRISLALDYKKIPLGGSVPANIKLFLHEFLETLKRALDYTAHDIADKYPPRNGGKNIYFPIAGRSEDRSTFEAKLENWFVGLKMGNRALYDCLCDVQHFGRDAWLADLNAFANEGKHEKLTNQVAVATEHGAVLSNNLFMSPGSRIENKGEGTLLLTCGDKKLYMRGPSILTTENVEDFERDAGFPVVRFPWFNLVRGVSRQPVFPFVETALTNTEEVTKKVYRLL